MTKKKKTATEVLEKSAEDDDIVVGPCREITEEEKKKLMTRLQKARTKLLAMVPFFGHLCLNFKPREARPGDNVPTAAVARDGTLILNYDFVEQLTDAQVCGLLAHEILHPALFCWDRQGTRAAIVSGPNGARFSLWNLAHDLSFNGQIMELANKSEAAGEVELPPRAAHDKTLDGMSAEEIYDDLLQKAIKNKQQGKGGQGSMGVLTSLPGGGHAIGDDMRDDLAESRDGQQAAQGDKGAQQKLENEWRVNILAAAQVQEQEKGQGTLPGGLQKIVDALKNPRVDWKDILSRWIGENGRRSDYTYRRPARRSESIGEYLPSLQKFGVDDVVVLWDTSGSMNGREGEILGDVQAICEDLGLSLRVMTCDAAIQGDFKDVQDVSEIIDQICGGGGSCFLPAFNRLSEEDYDGVVVCFTDGYISVPETKPIRLKACLWVIGPHDVDPSHGKWGDVLKVNDGEVVGSEALR